MKRQSLVLLLVLFWVTSQVEGVAGDIRILDKGEISKYEDLCKKGEGEYINNVLLPRIRADIYQYVLQVKGDLAILMRLESVEEETFFKVGTTKSASEITSEIYEKIHRQEEQEIAEKKAELEKSVSQCCVGQRVEVMTNRGRRRGLLRAIRVDGLVIDTKIIPINDLSENERIRFFPQERARYMEQQMVEWRKTLERRMTMERKKMELKAFLSYGYLPFDEKGRVDFSNMFCEWCPRRDIVQKVYELTKEQYVQEQKEYGVEYALKQYATFNFDSKKDFKSSIIATLDKIRKDKEAEELQRREEIAAAIEEKEEEMEEENCFRDFDKALRKSIAIFNDQGEFDLRLISYGKDLKGPRGYRTVKIFCEYLCKDNKYRRGAFIYSINYHDIRVEGQTLRFYYAGKAKYQQVFD